MNIAQYPITQYQYRSNHTENVDTGMLILRVDNLYKYTAETFGSDVCFVVFQEHIRGQVFDR